jgi:hypothetical protein
MTVELIHKHLLVGRDQHQLSSVEAAIDCTVRIRRLHHHVHERYHSGAINPVDVHHHFNEVLLKIVRRNISSIPTNNTPEHTIMKRQTILSIAFSIFAVNAFAATSAQPVVAEGGSDRLIENRMAEGGSDRLIQNRVAEGGSDRLIENRVAADGSDRLQGNTVAADGSDRLQGNTVAADGSDRLQGNTVAADGSDRLQGNTVAADGSDRLQGNTVAADGSDRLQGNTVA